MKTKLTKLNRISKFIDLDKFYAIHLDSTGIELVGKMDLLDSNCHLFDFSGKTYGSTPVMVAKRGNINITLF